MIEFSGKILVLEVIQNSKFLATTSKLKGQLVWMASVYYPVFN